MASMSFVDCPECGTEIQVEAFIDPDDQRSVESEDLSIGEADIIVNVKEGDKKVHDDTVAMNPRDPGTDAPESRFRYKVRDLLGLSWDTRDDRILDEIRRLKQIESRVAATGR